MTPTYTQIYAAFDHAIALLDRKLTTAPEAELDNLQRAIVRARDALGAVRQAEIESFGDGSVAA